MVIVEPKPSNDLLEITFITDKQEMKAIIDTGSNLNLISSDVINKFSIKPNILSKEMKVKGISDDEISIENDFELNFNLITTSGEKLQMISRFFILKNANFDILLGNQFLVENEAKINLSKKILTIKGMEIEIKDDNLTAWRESPDIDLSNKTSSFYISNFKNSVLQIIERAKEQNPLQGKIQRYRTQY
ncbi:hypothetical protein DMUE_2709 [Dictyocoela muelleri]|nr:hypothetical protein DMUE_2709 [Dictyocoela muelleri]